MSQFARPNSDVTFLLLGGTPTNTAGNRYQNIDEATASDTDYVYSSNNPGGSSLSEFGLSSVTDPVSSSGHVLRIRCFQIDEDSGSHPMSANTSGTATTLGWQLLQGATVIASGSINPGAEATTPITLSGTEADAITNYADLRVSLNPGGGAGSPANRRGVAISWIELEVPDAAASTTANAEVATGTGATQGSGASLGPVPATATGSGTAQTAGAGATPISGTAGGTGAGLAPTPGLGPVSPTIAALAAAYDVSGLVAASLGLASGTGTAHDPTVQTGSGTTANAGLATGTGAALGVTGAVVSGAGAATGTGVAQGMAAGVRAGAATAAGTGAGVAPGTGLSLTAGFATATGTASDATVDASGSTTATAGLASGTGQAHDPSIPGSVVIVGPGPPRALGWHPVPVPR